jgi:hypothetical protein
VIDLTSLREGAQRFMKDNATTILTGTGVVGTVATAVLTAKASFAACEKLILEETNYAVEHDGHGGFNTKDKIKVVWPLYIPPVAVGSATVASIVLANRMSAQRAAALAAAYGLAESRLQEYRGKVLEKVTGPKGIAIDDEVAQDRVNRNPPEGQVIILAGGEVLCYDMYTDRYFRSTVEAIRKAENDINGELFHHQYASLSSFYEKVGLPPTSFSDEVGWNQATTGPVELRFSTVKSPDEKPCIAFDFIVPPRPDYSQLY